MDEIDASLFLSVHHQLVAQNDLDYANEFFRALALKTRMRLFFQPACILRKYKKPMPFGDNDMQAIVTYFLDLLEGIFPHSGLVGFSDNDAPRQEPLRPMLLFSHKPIQPYPVRDVIGPINDLRLAGSEIHPLKWSVKHFMPSG